MHLTDIHCHLQDSAFAADLDRQLAKAATFGIGRFIVNGTSPKDWPSVSDLAEKYSGKVIPQFGVHPWQVINLPEDWQKQLTYYLMKHPEAGVGEIGLDLQLTEAALSLQNDVFESQLLMAKQLNRACTVHLIKAWAEFDASIKKVLPNKTLLHSFGGSIDQMRHYAVKGCYYSFGGAVLRQPLSKKLKAVIESVPEDRLLLETDAPFQHPEGKGHRQEPIALLRVAEKIAELRGIKTIALLKQCEQNVQAWLG